MLEQLRVAARALRVTNALSDEMDTLRTSLLPSLVNVAALNHDVCRSEDTGYEMASVFLARGGDKTPRQRGEPMRLGVVADAGATAESGRQAFYAMKSVLDGCLRELGSPSCTYQRAATELFHPGRCAAVFLDARQLGYLGEPHPSVGPGARVGGRGGRPGAGARCRRRKASKVAAAIPRGRARSRRRGRGPPGRSGSTGHYQ